MTLFWLLLGLMGLVAIAAIAIPFIRSKKKIDRSHGAILAGTILVLIAGSGGLYDLAGRPDLVANPPQPRISPKIMAMVKKLETAMALNPNYTEGWLFLARAYTQMGKIGQAMDAYRNVVNLDPTNTTAAAALGGLLIRTSGGDVPPEAMKLFQGIVDRGIFQPMAYYFLGLGDAQSGQFEKAYNVWMKLAEKTPDGAPWIKMLQGGLTDVAQKLGRPVPQLPLAEAGSDTTDQQGAKAPSTGTK